VFNVYAVAGLGIKQKQKIIIYCFLGDSFQSHIYYNIQYYDAQCRYILALLLQGKKLNLGGGGGKESQTTRIIH